MLQKVFGNFELIPINGIKKEQIQETLKNRNFYFSCTQCGQCCYGPGSVYFSSKDLERIRKYLRIHDKDWHFLLKALIQKKQNGLWIHQVNDKCLFLDKKHHCRIYPVRPIQCRTFPFWPQYFSSESDFKYLIQSCPGSHLSNQSSIKKNIFSPLSVLFRCNQTIRKLNRLQISKRKEDLISL